MVDATLRIIAEDGVEAATTRRIAAAAGVGQSGLFYSFGSRDGLLAAVVEAGIDAEIASFDGLLAELDVTSPSPGVTLDELFRQGLDVYLAALAADPAKERALISLALYAQRTPGIEHLATRLYQGYYDLVTRVLDAASASAQFTWTKPSAELAPLVVAFTDGLTMAYLAHPDGDFAGLIDGAVALLMGYVKPCAD
ncbi:TetR family transcriptional regulator [Gordonia sp. TBRC 11910]|uniref:TetR family transcriptional regulator n=1 Tax=Gordonia asplenii TaxID=2725283 RepID=A0A848KS19_9ACTN|nr:TetR family transcriptional regulator [Gordonia asplenii]